MRDNLVEWQWSTYARNHRDPRNLLIHLVAVPGFGIGLVGGLLAIGFDLVWLGLSGFGLTAVCFVLQAVGHRLEAEPPIPFDGPGDAIARILTEQFLTFWRYLASGDYLRAFKKA
ncbi:MAG: Mpo1-like protein [Myxococcota bacterium]